MSSSSDQPAESASSCCCPCLLTWAVALVVVVYALLQTRLRYHVKMFGYLVALMVGGTLGGLACVFNGRTPDNHFRMFAVFQWFCGWMRLKFTLRHKENIASSEPFILIGNHQSAIDVLGMSYCWPRNCVVMLKSSLRFLPGFNLCAYLANSIYINRFSKDKALATVDNTAAEIRENKRKVWIYPEGTRNNTGRLLPFKKGAFILAHDAKIPIVCCVFSSHGFFYDYESRWLADSGECLVEFLPPIESTKYDTVEQLMNDCQKLMQETFDRLNVEMEEKTGQKLKKMN